MNVFFVVLSAALLALIIVPVLVKQFTRPEPRRFNGIRLDQTNYQKIRFRNHEQGIDLAGLLFVPEGEGPFPAAVIIHGSGTSQRDNRWYLTLTQYLQDNRILVLLPDKRGSEGSGGNWRTASFEDLARDAIAAITYLQNQEDVALSGIGVIGLSQGGHIAPLVTDRVQDLAFLVNIVGGAIPMHDLLIYEETHNLRQAGILPGLAEVLARISAWSIINLRQRDFWEAIGNFDPVPYWKKLSVDSLVLYGENDTNVPSGESAEILRSLGNPKIDVRIYKGSGHALESPPGEGDRIFREDALNDIRDFVYSATAHPGFQAS